MTRTGGFWQESSVPGSGAVYPEGKAESIAGPSKGARQRFGKRREREKLSAAGIVAEPSKKIARPVRAALCVSGFIPTDFPACRA
jgi:hypothetical protein